MTAVHKYMSPGDHAVLQFQKYTLQIPNKHIQHIYPNISKRYRTNYQTDLQIYPRYTKIYQGIQNTKRRRGRPARPGPRIRSRSCPGRLLIVGVPGNSFSHVLSTRGTYYSKKYITLQHAVFEKCATITARDCSNSIR